MDKNKPFSPKTIFEAETPLNHATHTYVLLFTITKSVLAIQKESVIRECCDKMLKSNF